jgi:hypothetical protein
MKARRMENVEVRFTANLPTVLSSRLAPQTIGGVMTLSVNVLQLTRAQAVAKRACDVLISGLGLLALLPVFAVVAAAIKLTSPGPRGWPGPGGPGWGRSWRRGRGRRPGGMPRPPGSGSTAISWRVSKVTSQPRARAYQWADAAGSAASATRLTSRVLTAAGSPSYGSRRTGRRPGGLRR